MIYQEEGYIQSENAHMILRFLQKQHQVIECDIVTHEDYGACIYYLLDTTNDCMPFFHFPFHDVTVLMQKRYQSRWQTSDFAYTDGM